MDIAGCSLAELVKDPLIGLVMKSDGVERRVQVARERLRMTGRANSSRPWLLTTETAR